MTWTIGKLTVFDEVLRKNITRFYCCERFKDTVETKNAVYDRLTRFNMLDGKWWTDFSDGEYGDIQLDYCPFCGSKL